MQSRLAKGNDSEASPYQIGHHRLYRIDGHRHRRLCTIIAITPTTKATKYTQVKNIKGRLNLFQTAFDIYVFFSNRKSIILLLRIADQRFNLLGARHHQRASLLHAEHRLLLLLAIQRAAGL